MSLVRTFVGQPLTGRAVWTAAELGRIVPEPAPGSEVVIARRVADALVCGCGFAWLRGVGVGNPEEMVQRVLALGRLIGTISTQNPAGDLFRAVTDSRGLNGPVPGPASHSNRSSMGPHTDSADFVGLLCVRPAKSGGATTVCSTPALYNATLQERPEYLVPLSRGFYFDIAGKAPDAWSVTRARIPVFHRCGKDFSCTFNRSRILLGMTKAGERLTAVEARAVDHMETIARSGEFEVRFSLNAGDLLFLNSHVTLHGRDAYDDWTDGDRKRLLVRVWVNRPRLWNTWAKTEEAVSRQ